MIARVNLSKGNPSDWWIELRACKRHNLGFWLTTGGSIHGLNLTKPPNLSFTTEMYLSHGVLGEEFFPHLPNVPYPTLLSAPLFTPLDDYQCSIHMAYFDNNANFYPTFSVPEELYAYQSLNQTLAIEETNNNVYGTFANHWGTDEQPGPTTDLSTSLWDVTSHGKYHCDSITNRCLTLEYPESLAPVTSYPTYTDGYGQLSYADNYWSAIQQARFYVPEFSSRDVSFADTAASEMSIAVPTPSSGEHLFLL